MIHCTSLSLPSIRKMVEINDEGKIKSKVYINLGISFDHSFLDATLASNFLSEIIENTKNFNDLLGLQ